MKAVVLERYNMIQSVHYALLVFK